MEFRILGPLQVRANDKVLQLGGPGQRVVLAALLLEPNRVVSVSRLIDVLWGPDPPVTATAQVQARVSGLRRSLAEGGAVGDVIATRPPGYLITVGQDELDLTLFEHHARDATAVLGRGQPERAADGFRAALALWRGPALGGVPGPLAESEAARLQERRLAVLEQRIEADLALGRHGDLVAELGGLVAEHPLREGLRAQLMLALYRSGRQADALHVYQQARHVLAEELGLEPGAALQRMQHAVLARDPALELPRETKPPSPAPTAAPAQLPADIADFTGRAKQVDQLCDLLGTGPSTDRPSTVVVSAVAGTAGVGKTALAVHVAHRLLDVFCDGQLYVNLRGAEPNPVEPATILEQFLRTLGVDPGAIPADPGERAALYRSRVADKRLLVLLDNAAGPAQVRPLLPGTTGCGVLITSRGRLAGLAGTSLVDLDVLEPEDALALLTRVVGPDRVNTQRAAAERITAACGRLPLALRIAGARLVARPQWPLARLADALADEQRRLDELRIGDLEVRASLGLSYEGLPPEARRALRKLALLHAADTPSWVAAALLDASLPEAEDVLDRLVDAQLLEVSGPDRAGQDRYRLHDLVRVYGRERAETEDSPDERAAALARAVAGWLALAERANRKLLGRDDQSVHGNAPRWRLAAGETDALLTNPADWFDAERDGLFTAVERAAAAGLDELSWELANVLAFVTVVRGHFDQGLRIHEHALAAARRSGDSRGVGAMLRCLGRLHALQDRYDDALDCFHQASAAFRVSGERRGEAYVDAALGVVSYQVGRGEDALRCFDRARVTFAAVEDRRREGFCRYGFGLVYLDRGDLTKARTNFEQTLAIYSDLGYHRGEAQALHRLGEIDHAQGQLDEAAACLQRSLESYAELGDRRGHAYALAELGAINTDQQRPAVARSRLERCLADFRELGVRHGEALTLRSLGEVHRAEACPDRAVACLEAAARIWEQLALPAWQARTLRILADVHDENGYQAAAEAVRRAVDQLDAPQRQ